VDFVSLLSKKRFSFASKVVGTSVFGNSTWVDSHPLGATQVLSNARPASYSFPVFVPVLLLGDGVNLFFASCSSL